MPAKKYIFYVKFKNHDDGNELSFKILAGNHLLAVKRAITKLKKSHNNYWPYYVSEGVYSYDDSKKRSDAGKRGYEKSQIIKAIKARDDAKYLYPDSWQGVMYDYCEDNDLFKFKMKYFDFYWNLKRGNPLVEALDIPDNVK